MNKIGKTTEILAKIMRVISIASWLLILVAFYSLNQTLGNGGGVAIVCILGYAGYWSLKRLYNPLINIYKNTILFLRHKISDDFYKKKKRNSLIASIILVFTGIGLIVAIPTWIFLSKTKKILRQEEYIVQEEPIIEQGINVTQISNDDKSTKQSYHTQKSRTFYGKKWNNKIIGISVAAICVIGIIIGLTFYNNDSEITYSTEYTTMYDENVRNDFHTKSGRRYTTYGKNIEIEIRSKFDNRGNKIEAYYYVLPEKYLKSKYTYKYNRRNNLIEERMYASEVGNSELKSIDTYKYNSKGEKIEQWSFKIEHYVNYGERIGVSFSKLDGDGYVLETGSEYSLTEEGFKKYMKKNHSVVIQ